MNNEIKIFQQGDVLLIPCEIIGDPKSLKTGVIQEGEHTGHAHRFMPSDDAMLFEQPKTKKRHLRLLKPTTITHEEHKPIDLPPGDYEVRIVREYDHFKEESRAVLD